MFRIISHKSWWSWMVNFSPSAKWLQHLRQESRRKLLEFLDLHLKETRQQKLNKNDQVQSNLSNQKCSKTLIWSPKAMTTLFLKVENYAFSNQNQGHLGSRWVLNSIFTISGLINYLRHNRSNFVPELFNRILPNFKFGKLHWRLGIFRLGSLEFPFN